MNIHIENKRHTLKMDWQECWPFFFHFMKFLFDTDPCLHAKIVYFQNHRSEIHATWVNYGRNKQYAFLAFFFLFHSFIFSCFFLPSSLFPFRLPLCYFSLFLCLSLPLLLLTICRIATLLSRRFGLVISHLWQNFPCLINSRTNRSEQNYVNRKR